MDNIYIYGKYMANIWPIYGIIYPYIFNIYRAFASEKLTKELTNKYKEGIAWGEAKELLFELLEEKINPLRKKYEVLIDDREGLEKILLSGAEKALDVSTPIINKVRQAVGIRSFGD